MRERAARSLASRVGLGRLGLARNPEPQRFRTQEDHVSARQLRRRLDSAATDESPVLATEILEGGAVARDDDAGVTAGNLCRVDRDDGVLGPPQDVLAFDQLEVARPPGQAAGDALARDWSRRSVVLGARRERIAEPVDGPYEPSLAGVVSQGPPHLGDELRKARP